MANDRLYLRCKACKTIQLLAKYNVGYTYIPNDDRVNLFLTEHLLTCREGDSSHLGIDPGIELLTEAMLADQFCPPNGQKEGQ